jgi:hypothetical protein
MRFGAHFFRIGRRGRAVVRQFGRSDERLQLLIDDRYRESFRLSKSGSCARAGTTKIVRTKIEQLSPTKLDRIDIELL